MIPVTFVAESNAHEWKADVMALPHPGDSVYLQPAGVRVGYAPGQSSYDWTVRRVVHVVSGNRPVLRDHEIRIIVA